MRLIDAVDEAERRGARNNALVLRFGKVVSFTSKTVRATLDGVNIDAARMAAYNPVAGEKVILFGQAGAWLAIGAVPAA